MSKSIFKKENYSWPDLEELIKDGIEESLNLEYKSSQSLINNDHNKKEIAKDVSAFANSDGGLIIYGIKEENHKPIDFAFVDGSKITKEWLENVIDGNIQQRISNIEIYPIRYKNDLNKSVFVVKIPASTEAPHMSLDKKYYRRYNFKSVPMEEYEIRLLYKRESQSEIDFDGLWTRNVVYSEYENEEKTAIRELTIQVKNISKVIEKHCKVEVFLKNVDDLKVIFLIPKNSKVNNRFSSDKDRVISAYNESPIFPNEIMALLRFELSVKAELYEDLVNRAVVNVKLYNSNIIKTIQYKLSELTDKTLFNG